MEIILIITGVLIGLVIGFLYAKSKYQNSSGVSIEQFQVINQKLVEVSSDRSKLEAEKISLSEKLTEQKIEIEKLQERFITEFQNLANKILDDKSKKFTELNKENLNNLLDPLKDKISDFERNISQIHKDNLEKQSSLSQQIKTLHEESIKVSSEANNLTKALKGSTRTQGSWGEFILESVLEKSGLVKDREYFMQTTFKSGEGDRLRPDVVVNLPEGKSMVIDSKVSLVAYERFCSTEDETEQKDFLNEHVASIKRHVKNLSGKDYRNIYGLQSLDFVLMFVPIEPAFGLAVQGDANIFYEAFENNIVIVSPSTLLATLRTIASIWKQEKQTKNAIEIAKESGEMYDKFVNFVNDLIEVGKKMDSAKSSYTDAMKKLSEGSGNLVSRSQKLKEMGVKSSKNLPDNLIERSKDENDQMELIR